MSKGLNDSQFHIWRALFAFAHADDVVDNEEVSFMAKVLELVPFSGEQVKRLKKDVHEPQDVEEMFTKITDQNDRSTFLHYARMMAWCDGDFSKEEQETLAKLQLRQLREVDFEKMIGDAHYPFEGDDERFAIRKEYEELNEKGRRGILKALAWKFRKG